MPGLRWRSHRGTKRRATSHTGCLVRGAVRTDRCKNGVPQGPVGLVLHTRRHPGREGLRTKSWGNRRKGQVWDGGKTAAGDGCGTRFWDSIA